jgi:hypothetical protein
MSAPPTQVTSAPSDSVPLPNASTVMQAVKLAMTQDKPIQLDYYADSLSGRAYLGEDSETKEKMLVKSKDEFTSTVSKLYKVAEDYIILTENSIYIVSGKTGRRIIKASSLRSE